MTAAVQDTFDALLDSVTVPGETWLPAVGYERTYRISSLGRVFSRPRPTTPGGLLRQSRRVDGYLVVSLVQDGVQRLRPVHILVAEAFIGPRPADWQTRHMDGNPGNPAASNLSYGTVGDNLRDRRRHGTDPQVNKTHCPSGHEYTPENIATYPSLHGRRACLTCFRKRTKLAKRQHTSAPWVCPVCGSVIRRDSAARHVMRESRVQR